MLRTIQQQANGPEPVRFILQSGDAVVNGRPVREAHLHDGDRIGIGPATLVFEAS